MMQCVQKAGPRSNWVLVSFLICVCGARMVSEDAKAFADESGSRVEALHPMTRQSVYPSEGSTVVVNPPSLLWPAVRNRDVRYQVRLSQDPNFPESRTVEAENLRWATFNPHRELRSGKWYWQYFVSREGKTQEKSRIHSFTVPASARVFVTPSAEKMVATCPSSHPRILVTLDELDVFRNRVKSSPEAKSIVGRANKYLGWNLPTEDSGRPKRKGSNTYENKSFAKWASKALGNQLSASASTLAKAYIITGDEKFGREAIRHAVHVAQWDPNGVTSYKVSDFADGACLRAMALAYDSCFDLLTDREKTMLQNAIRTRSGSMFNRWRNNLETRVFSAHIWQHILHEFAEAAFATLGEITEAKQWAAYVYELWLARVPLMGGNDGGWANGNGYFGTNFVTLISIPTFFRQLTGVNFFDNPWYQNTIYYMIYTWPPGSCPDGFGDGCEQRELSPLSRLAFADILGREFDDPYAAWYVQKSLHSLKTELDRDTSLRWCRLRMGHDWASGPAKPYVDLPQARLFQDIGVVTMHTNLADAPNNFMLAFRSSPYGSFNHAHADQNSFNLLFGGKRLFCNTGYYIAYGDEHFSGWYKHSRGHNTVLIDNKGQVMGTTEAFGRIPRYLHGRRITYCMGDASGAYGQAGLTCFRRHIALLRPSTLVIYDELEADHPAQWSWLLHSPGKISLDAANNRLFAGVETAGSQVDFSGSVPLSFKVDNRFDPPALNWRKRTYNGKLRQYPDQWHAVITSGVNASRMRYLAVIQVRSPGDRNAFDETTSTSNSSFQIGPWSIYADLDPSRSPALEIHSLDGKAVLAANTPFVDVAGERYRAKNSKSTILVELLPDKTIFQESTETSAYTKLQ